MKLASMIAASATALTIAAWAAPAAEAKTRVHVGIGIGVGDPFYDPFYEDDCNYSFVFDQCSPFGRVERPYGFYRPYPRYRYVDRVSCREAHRALRNTGYRNIAVRDCTGRYYAFDATRNGRSFRVNVNAVTGDITRHRK